MDLQQTGKGKGCSSTCLHIENLFIYQVVKLCTYYDDTDVDVNYDGDTYDGVKYLNMMMALMMVMPWVMMIFMVMMMQLMWIVNETMMIMMILFMRILMCW